MTTQELLKPRYLLTIRYPHYPFDDTILFVNDKGELYHEEEGYCQSIYKIMESDAIKSACFRPLQWWEHRKPEDMPEYVKGLNVVKKVNAIEDHGGDYPSILCEGETIWGTIWMYEPATLEEYNSYLTQKQKQ